MNGEALEKANVATEWRGWLLWLKSSSLAQRVLGLSAGVPRSRCAFCKLEFSSLPSSSLSARSHHPRLSFAVADATRV
jgi:hypothetical protein